MDWIKLEELKKLAERATPGAWEAISCAVCLSEQNNEQKILGGFEDYDDEENDRYAFGYNNAQFVAAANPVVVLELIARIKELEAENHDFRAISDPQALTAAHMVGCEKGRDEAKAKIEQLEKEADWLAT